MSTAVVSATPKEISKETLTKDQDAKAITRKSRVESIVEEPLIMTESDPPRCIDLSGVCKEHNPRNPYVGKELTDDFDENDREIYMDCFDRFQEYMQKTLNKKAPKSTPKTIIKAPPASHSVMILRDGKEKMTITKDADKTALPKIITKFAVADIHEIFHWFLVTELIKQTVNHDVIAMLTDAVLSEDVNTYDDKSDTKADTKDDTKDDTKTRNPLDLLYSPDFKKVKDNEIRYRAFNSNRRFLWGEIPPDTRWFKVRITLDSKMAEQLVTPWAKEMNPDELQWFNLPEGKWVDPLHARSFDKNAALHGPLLHSLILWTQVDHDTHQNYEHYNLKKQPPSVSVTDQFSTLFAKQKWLVVEGNKRVHTWKTMFNCAPQMVDVYLGLSTLSCVWLKDAAKDDEHYMQWHANNYTTGPPQPLEKEKNEQVLERVSAKDIVGSSRSSYCGWAITIVIIAIAVGVWNLLRPLDLETAFASPTE